LTVDYVYRCVRLPSNLLDEASKLIGKRGFTSHSEVVKQALREYLDECYSRGIISENEAIVSRRKEEI
jgi:metal-responsive CopG/Arc/MetJ family transcriptional regulator